MLKDVYIIWFVKNVIKNLIVLQTVNVCVMSWYKMRLTVEYYIGFMTGLWLGALIMFIGML